MHAYKNPAIYEQGIQICYGVPEAIRTPDPFLRREVLYPAELRRHEAYSNTFACIEKARLCFYFFTKRAEKEASLLKKGPTLLLWIIS